MTIRIVTDSTADLDPATLERHGIVVVPLNVHLGEQTFLDTVTLTKSDFYLQMQASQLLPRTSQPSAGAFQEAYEQIIAQGETAAIASIHISSKLSGTVNAAQTGAGLLTDPPPIVVIDSNSTTLGLGNAVLAAAEAAESGADMDGVRAACISASERTRVLLFVDTLEYLQKGGRIGRARAFLGTLLRTKPLLELRDGEIEGIERPRTRQKAIDRLFQTIVRTPHPEHIEILYGTTPDDAQSLADRVKAALPEIPVGIVQVSSVIGVHTGPAALGASILRLPG
jgi:DegV family protein with EDD domain